MSNGDRLTHSRRARRGVEEYYNWYDPPETIWIKVSSKSWEYNQDIKFYEARDLAFLSLLYIATARTSEVTRANLVSKKNPKGILKPSIDTRYFKRKSDRLLLRKLPIIKRRDIKSYREYPTRREITIPLEGWLSNYGESILKYLLMLNHGEELFKFGRKRGYQIADHVTGETQHYLREMGIKLYYRLFNRNLQDLKKFTGHARIENLFRYLGEAEIEDKLFNNPSP